MNSYDRQLVLPSAKQRLRCGMILLLAFQWLRLLLEEGVSTLSIEPSLVADYIIVGAGVAGSALAARLSEDRHSRSASPQLELLTREVISARVLLIEAGPFDAGEPFITIPGLVGGAIGTKYDWNLTSLVEPKLEIGQFSYQQGK